MEKDSGLKENGEETNVKGAVKGAAEKAHRVLKKICNKKALR